MSEIEIECRAPCDLLVASVAVLMATLLFSASKALRPETCALDLGRRSLS